MRRSLKQRAVLLRKRGWSYNIISGRIGVAKSTLSAWLRDVPYKPNEIVVKRIGNGPAKSSITNRRKKLKSIVEARRQGVKDVGVLSKRDLMMLGIGLYIGEGGKAYEDVRLTNSDPEVIRAGVLWFRKVLGVCDDNFGVRLHLYPDSSENESIKFWSKVSGIPRSNFKKSIIDRRINKSSRKKRFLPYGTADVKVYSYGNPKFGALLHRKIMGWIEATYGQISVRKRV